MNEIYDDDDDKDDVDESRATTCSPPIKRKRRVVETKKADTGEEKVKGGNWPSWGGRERGSASVVEPSLSEKDLVHV